MGVRNTADEALDEAGKQLKEAITNINKLLIHKCWGCDEYTEEYKEKLWDAQFLLMEAAKKLSRS
jgi:hypothetical protein